MKGPRSNWRCQRESEARGLTVAAIVYTLPDVTTETTIRYGVREARRILPTLIENVAEQGARVVITNFGEDRVAVVSVADLRRLEELDAKKKPAKRR